MQELKTNFQNKYGQQVPMPKIYGDEDSSDSEGLELADRTKVGKKTTGGAGGSSGSQPRKKSAAGGRSSGAGGSGGGGSASAGGSSGPSTSGGGGVGGSGGRKRGRDDDGDDDDPNKRRKTGGEGGPPKPMVACKEPRKVGTVYPPINRKLSLKESLGRIHLTLPTSPAHVTTTETFKTFFINHGLTRALRKAFESRGWSTNQMQELRTNFQNKYGQQVPMPKIYGDEDSSDSEGLELADGTKVGKKTTGGAGGSGGSQPHKKSAAGGRSSGAGGSGGGGSASAGGSSGPSTSGGGGVGGSGGRKRGRDDDGDDDDPNKRRKTGVKVDHQNRWWPVRNHVKWAQFTPRSTESCQSFTSLVRKREPCWAIAC